MKYVLFKSPFVFSPPAQLADVDSIRDTRLRRVIRSIRAVKLFYVTSGRNAWWTTWITRYFPGCMHATLDSARKYAEQNRVQGTVFYIGELPSIAFDTGEGVLVVSEINTERFFSRFRVKNLQKDFELMPRSSITLSQVVDLFRSDSAMWVAGYPLRNSSILSFCDSTEKLVALNRGQRLISWVSSSIGGNQALRWFERPFKKQHSCVHTLVAAMNGLVG